MGMQCQMLAEFLMNLNQSIYRRRKLTSLVGLALSLTAMAIGLFVLTWIMVILFVNGFAALDVSLFTQSTPAPGSEGGGGWPMQLWVV